MISATLSYLRDTTKQARAQAARPALARGDSEADDMSDRGQAVTLMPGEPVVIEGNRRRSRRCSTTSSPMRSNMPAVPRFHSAEADGRALIEVCDDGPGVPPEEPGPRLRALLPRRALAQSRYAVGSASARPAPAPWRARMAATSRSAIARKATLRASEPCLSNTATNQKPAGDVPISRRHPAPPNHLSEQ